MSFEKFRILLWKNWIIKKRHYKGGIFELIFPMLLIILFTWIKKEFGADSDQPSEIRSYNYSTVPSVDCAMLASKNFNILMSPESPWLEEFVQSVVNVEERKVKGDLKTFANAKALDDYFVDKPKEELFLGIEFDDELSGSTERPKILKYALRLQSFYIGNVNYCFADFQNDIDRAFMATFGLLDPPQVTLKPFYYVESTLDQFTTILKVLLPVVLILSTFFSANKIIKNVAHERESQLKETMRIMGLSNTLHWSAWFTSSIMVITLAFTLVTIFIKYKIIAGIAILEHSNVFLIWIFFLFYNTTVITFCFLISVIFKKATTAATVGTILFFVTFVVYYQFRGDFEESNYFLKLLFCLPVNSGLGYGTSMILDLERIGDGLNFSNIFSRLIDYEFSIGEVLMCFIIASVLQLLLMSYIEQVFMGGIGIAKPWYFPVSPIVNLFKSKTSEEVFIENEKQHVSIDNFEQDPINLTSGIKITDLCKVFGKASAVNKLNLNMYENQITVLLGHNGAGKTTTMNMLTGMFSPSSGTAYINGHDIRTEITEARKSLGMCPQHNILLDDLTVKEHIILFCRLKGVSSSKEIDIEVAKYGELLDFNDKIDALSKTLSGGQKRKLSIGVALCGNSKVVMLDEPTSGLDAGARRALWNLLIEEKKGRTILLTTHHMDEADVLGDRIAIMNDGQLQTVGSSFFLKKRFGSGYKFICVKNPGCNPTEIQNILSKFDPNVKLESNGQTEVVFVINEDRMPVFHKMFKKIEDDQKRLKISSFGCSLTTLEEVFIKVGSTQNAASLQERQDSNFDNFIPSKKVGGFVLILNQIYSIILKKFHYTRRNTYSICWLTLMSIGIVYVFLAAPIDFENQASTFELGSDEVSFSSLNETITFLEHDGSDPELANSYRSMFRGKDKIIESDEKFENFMLNAFRVSQIAAIRNNLIAAAIEKNEITGWYQSVIISSFLRILTLNTIHRAMLKKAAGAEYDLLVSCKNIYEVYDYNSEKIMAKADEGENELPILTPEEELRFDAMIVNFTLLFFIFYFIIVFWPSIFIAIKVKERVTRSKLLQFICGANRFVYWLTSFFIDYIFLMIVTYIVVGVVALQQRAYFRTGEQLGTLIALFSIHGFAYLPFVYVLSFVFEKPSTAESMISIFGLMFGVVYTGYALFKFLLNWNIFANIYYWIMLLFSPFSVLDSFRKIAFGSFEEDFNGNFFHFGTYGLGANFVMMIVSGILFMSFCLLKDYLIIERLIYKFSNQFRQMPSESTGMMDDDVKNEKDKIKQLTSSQLLNENLVLQGVCKFYKSNLAVNQLHLGIENAECFGLLGINGAGKTSTFKMMTGDESISGGDVWIRGCSMKNDMLNAQNSIGYCPQFDALLFDISGREILKIFALIRGIPRNEIAEIIVKLATELGFQMHLDKKIKAYSGGNKRKLSTALSLLGNPNLIFLDEPTTGIDPYSKRQLWIIINKTRNSGKSVILTSHSMEECEALCTRIAIMVAGEFKCLGSAQHLKNKFSKGYILTIKMERDIDAQLYEIQNRIHQMFPSALLKEKYMDLLTFHIASDSLKWSEVFRGMTEIKAEISITDFTITQMSLEQVFLHFTREVQNEISAHNGHESTLI